MANRVSWLRPAAAGQSSARRRLGIRPLPRGRSIGPGLRERRAAESSPDKPAPSQGLGNISAELDVS